MAESRDRNYKQYLLSHLIFIVYLGSMYLGQYLDDNINNCHFCEFVAFFLLHLWSSYKSKNVLGTFRDFCRTFLSTWEFIKTKRDVITAGEIMTTFICMHFIGWGSFGNLPTHWTIYISELFEIKVLLWVPLPKKRIFYSLQKFMLLIIQANGKYSHTCVSRSVLKWNI